MQCKNCENSIDGKFCSNCGQKSNVDRINFSNFSREITESVFQVNKGLFYTIRELFVRPGKSIRGFLNGKRKNHFKPIAFALLLSTLYFFITRITNQDTWMDDMVSGIMDAESERESGIVISTTFIWFSKNFAYSSLLLLPFFSLASFISFSGSDTNYLEHVVMNSYVAGQQAILYSLVAIIGVGVENSDLIATISLLISFLYLCWVYRQFFANGSRMVNLLCTLMTYVIYMIFCFFLLMANAGISALMNVK